MSERQEVQVLTQQQLKVTTKNGQLESSSTRDATVRERPILFSGAMVRAILDGPKTQTRRVVKPQPFEDEPSLEVGLYHPTVVSRDGFEEPGDEVFGVWNAEGDYAVRCPYGAVGDRLWVRENWQVDAPRDGTWADVQFYGSKYASLGDIPTRYRTPEHCLFAATWTHCELTWRPSIHMPRWASRLTLEITGVRVERLRDISEADAIAEGLQTSIGENSGQPVYGVEGITPDDRWNVIPKKAFGLLWNAINEKRGYGWDVNPYVWVISFASLLSTREGQ